MKYNLTDKLKFDDDPVIVVKDQEIKICSDADVVLTLMDVMENESEVAGLIRARALLFTPAEQKKIDKLKLKTKDYVAFMRASIDLAIGEDPDSEEAAGE